MVHVELLPAAIADCGKVQRQETIHQTEIVPELLLGQLCAIQLVEHGCKTCPTPHRPLQLALLLSPDLSLSIHRHHFILPLPILPIPSDGLPYTGTMSHVFQVGSLEEGLLQRLTY